MRSFVKGLKEDFEQEDSFVQTKMELLGTKVVYGLRAKRSVLSLGVGSKRGRTLDISEGGRLLLYLPQRDKQMRSSGRPISRILL